MASERIPRLLPYLCLGMFAGLRRSEAAKARWEDISWETNSVEAKTGKMRGVTNRFPELHQVFIDWLKPIAQAEGPMCTGDSARRADLKKLRELTFDFDSNIFRHTFGSYHYHFFRNPQKTQVEMGHTSLQMLHKHYRKPMPHDTAAKLWQLDRASVLGGSK